MMLSLSLVLFPVLLFNSVVLQGFFQYTIYLRFLYLFFNDVTVVEVSIMCNYRYTQPIIVNLNKLHLFLLELKCNFNKG